MRRIPLFLVVLATTVILAACQDDGGPLSSEPDVEATPPPGMGPVARTVEGYAEPGEKGSGWIFNRYGNAVEVEYEIHEGLAVWQGDIVIGKAGEVPTTRDELYARAALGTVSGSPNPSIQEGVVIDDNSKRWPNGVIPYTITDADNDVVMQAIEMIENQTPGVTLIPRTSETNYVTFRDATGCSSKIGMVGGQQFINLKVWDGESWCPPGSAAHEILHALGMYHEHTRCDRDGFVTIDYDEIESGKEGNFYKAGSGSEAGACSGAYDIDAYDFESIMHYPLDAFAVGDDPTIIPIVDVTGLDIGQRDALGPTDAETIDQLYGSNNAAPVADIQGPTGDLLEGSVLSFDATGSTDADDDYDILTFEWSFGDGTCPGPAACSDDNPDHTYADNGDYGYSVTVSDGFDASATGSSVTIANVAPDVDAGPDATVDEGSLFSQNGSFTDPGADTWSATVDYDDGAGDQALALVGMNFSLSYTYADNSVNNVTVTVTDDDGGVGTDDVEVTVLNVAPTVDAGPDATVESGQVYDFSGTFSDPGINDDPWSWVIDWGFGPDTNGQTNDQSAPIEASRQVCVAGSYAVTLTVTDKDGGEGSDALTLTVPYVSIEIDIMPGTDLNPISLRKSGNLPVAILGSMDLDVADIDPSTLTLGDETDPDTPIGQKNNGTYEAYMEDVNGDGYMDLVTMFPTRDLVNTYGDLTELTTELVLRGFQTDGCTNVRGSDVVTPQ